MNYYKRHVFFCCNQRDPPEACCNNHGASDMQAYAKQRIKELGQNGRGKTRINKAGCLDRVHVTVAPIILGDGRPSFPFGPIDRVDQALRPPMGIHSLGDEVLFDCDFAARRVPVWRANNLARPSQSDEENPSSRLSSQ